MFLFFKFVRISYIFPKIFKDFSVVFPISLKLFQINNLKFLQNVNINFEYLL